MNQNPEQIARDIIDEKLKQSGWSVQSISEKDMWITPGIALKEVPTYAGPADYMLHSNRKPLAIIEAKRENKGAQLSFVEEQSFRYMNSGPKKNDNQYLSFAYESNGSVIHFTDYRDPKPRSRQIFNFHRPETLEEWSKEEKTLRSRLLDLPTLHEKGLRACQVDAINNLEKSFKNNHPRALIQMATGAGKTFTAITAIYRLLKYAKAKRILFMVDTKNLGEQAEQEFMSFIPNDDNRKFTELYNVQRLKSSYIASGCEVYISTIQRLYSILKGEELDERCEEKSPYEDNSEWKQREPMPVVYNENLPPEFFDFIVIDECHRSIYNVWSQVLEYFDAFKVGLTATPDDRTYGYFDENIVSEYTQEDAIADGVNVGYNIYLIETEITQNGASIWKGEYVDVREKLSRRQRREKVENDVIYTPNQLDDQVVNPSQIRNVIRTFKNNLGTILPGRTEVPKTLIFAKSDSHADDIIRMVREVFAEGNDFCKKVTYRSEEDPKSILSQFRNGFYPRIAVTVDMIATGTDVKPLEILLFMRDVKSKTYFEQMKGRGTRTISLDDLQKVTPSAAYTKDHFVIVDAIGVTKSMKSYSRSLERKSGTSLKSLLDDIASGITGEELFLTLGNRLARLDRIMTQKEKDTFAEKARSKTVNQVVKELFNAYDPDKIEDKAKEMFNLDNGVPPTEGQLKEAQDVLIEQAASTFNGKLNTYILNVRKTHEQLIDTYNIDKVKNAGWDTDVKHNAGVIIDEFKAYIEENKDRIIALQILYNQPYQRRNITYQMIKELHERIKEEKPHLAPPRIWAAYQQIEKVNGNPVNVLTSLVSLIRRVIGIDGVLTSFDKTVDKNFQDWTFKKQAGTLKFNEEQMQWLRMIKDYIATSFHIDKEDFDLSPFDSLGGLGKMWKIFGDSTDNIIDELNFSLVA